MTDTFEFAPWMARLRAPLLVALIPLLASCNTDSLTPNTGDPGVVDVSDPAAPGDGASLSVASYRAGIPMGMFQTPFTSLGARYNGTLRSIYPGNLLSELRAIKARGGRVILNLAGGPHRFTDRSGNFSLTMWKASVNRYRGVNFSSFINDGTVIGNFLIDEPKDPHNWRNHKAISPAVVEEMAKYSKAHWPNLITMARARPDYLLNNHRYLDAAWSQYHSRFGNPNTFVMHDAQIARNKRLGLVVGMNVLKGNGGRPMTATQIKSWGGALLSSTYPCAFLNWTYNTRYLSSRSMQDAMSYLRSRAQNRSTKTCRG